MLRKKILHIENLQAAYARDAKRLEAVRGVDISVFESEIVGIVGESGCGKSTVAKSILRLFPEQCAVSADAMAFAGVDLLTAGDKDMRKLRGRQMALVLQNAVTAFNPLRTVGSQIREILLRNGVERRCVKATALRMLHDMGIDDPQHMFRQYPHQCSGGMLQRALLGAIIACRPRLIIADEPTSSLDAAIQIHILCLLKNMSMKEKISVILITHDLKAAASICDRIMIMYGGLIMEEGTTAEVFQKPRHPYTRALLNALPDISKANVQRLAAIEGLPPSIENMPAGCPFAPRCSIAREKCRQEIPPLQKFADGHNYRCPYAGV